MSDTENTPQADAAANLSPAAPQASAAEIKTAEAMAAQLDPDLQAAILQGNSAIIQAVAAGATTNDQIAQRLISMGVTTGLPPGVQSMVNEQQDKIAQAREAEGLKEKAALAAGAAALFTMGTLIPEGGNNKDSTSTRPGYMQDIFDMNFGQKLNYLNDLEDISFDKYAAKTDAERRKDLENLKKESEATLATAKPALEKTTQDILSDPAFGDTPEKRKQALDAIEKATDINLLGVDSEKLIDSLPKEWRDKARERRSLKVDVHFSEDALKNIQNASDALDQKNLPAAHKFSTDAAGANRARLDKKAAYLAKGSEHISDLANNKNYDELRQFTAKTQDRAEGELVREAAAEKDVHIGVKAQVASLDVADSKAQSISQASAAEVNELDDAPMAVAAVAERKTIAVTVGDTGAKLALLDKLGAPEPAANDREEQQFTAKKPSGPPSSGMTA